MTKRSLTPNLRRTFEIVEQLRYGWVKRLYVVDGEPCYAIAPQVVEEVRLGSELDQYPETENADLRLKKAFESLFSQAKRVRNGVVDIKVRHARPIRLTIYLRHQELAMAALS